MTKTTLITPKQHSPKQQFLNSLKLTGYFLLALWLPFVSLSFDVFYLHNLVEENSTVEYSQDILLAIMTLLFARHAYQHPAARSGFVLMSCFFLTMLIREVDNFLDTALYHGAWKVFAFPVATFALIYAVLSPRETLTALNQFTQSKAFYSFIIGLLLVLVASRLIGMNALWSHILEHDFPRIVKHIAEEYSELLGYSVMGFSVLLFIRQA